LSTVRILSFGTGVLLRGLLADVAERAGMRITMASSTPAGDARARALADAGGAFTLRVRGLGPGGVPIDTARTVRSIDRAIPSTDPAAFLATAADPDIALVASNVSEAGFVVSEPKATSFPGRLAAWLRARRDALDAGVVVLPCELIAGNGARLRAMVRECDSDPEFNAWIDAHCPFADTLVDRICTQDPQDPLAALVEPWNFWAIQAEPTGAVAALAAAAPGEVVVAPDISRYMLRKVRILNGLHTAMASIAESKFGCATVRESLEHPELGPWLEALLREEILPAICPPLDPGDAAGFADATLGRMRNPFLEHRLSVIRTGADVKWETRLRETMRAYEQRFGRPPERISACRRAHEEQAG